MIGFAKQNHRKRSSKPMFLKNKVVIFAFQHHFSCFQSPIFSLDWKKVLSKIFGIFTTKIFDIFDLKNIAQRSCNFRSVGVQEWRFAYECRQYSGSSGVQEFRRMLVCNYSFLRIMGFKGFSSWSDASIFTKKIIPIIIISVRYFTTTFLPSLI